MSMPKVTFIVPCYKLAHFLTDCVNSILSQSHKNIEILILDDQSPDNTEEVSRGLVIANPQRNITYILNKENIGNICNYNKGIRSAKGEYVWILSPDDRLRNPNIVEKYVQLMQDHPEVGYTFCPGHKIENDQDMGLYKPSLFLKHNQILDGHQLAIDLVYNKFFVVAASVMVRKKCYEEITFFPEDMPHRGDTYVWALIAMQYKVAYFAEAMVDYRIHSGSMMSTWAREKLAMVLEDDIKVPWKIKEAADINNFTQIADQCWGKIVHVYADALFGMSCRGHTLRLSLSEFETSLAKFEANPTIRSWVRCRVFYMYGDMLYWKNNIPETLENYKKAYSLCGNSMSLIRLSLLLKLIFLKSGTAGGFFRHLLGKIHMHRIGDS